LIKNAVIVTFISLLIAGCNQPSMLQDRQTLEKEEDLRRNMRLVQVAAEHFAADHGSATYPVAVDDSFKTYFRGGIEGQTPAPVGLVNPFSGSNEFPTLGHIGDPISARSGERFSIMPGAIQYSPLDSGKGYAIVGGAHDGRALMDIYNPSQVLVLTNVTH
jgi:hypothetical protein